MNRLLLFVILFLILCNLSFSDGFDDGSVFVINDFVFNITGFTRPSALVSKGDLVTGIEIEGFDELEEYIADKTQLLFNQRVLDSVSIDYEIGQMRPDGKHPVDIIVNTNDTWNIVAIPRPQYSSSTGFDIILKARDYNFLGTMTPLRLDIGYKYDQDGKHSFLFELDSNIPFRAANLDWNIVFWNGFHYRPDTEQPFYFKNITGLSVDFKILTTTLTIGFNEHLYYNEENPNIHKPVHGDFQDGFYMASNPHLSWRIPTGLQVGEYGDLVFTPGVSAMFTHEFPEWPLDDIWYGPSLSFYYNFGFKKIDWIGNFLKGFDVSISNLYSYNFYRDDNDMQAWSANLKFNAIGHIPFGDVFAFSGRISYRHWFFDDFPENAGDVLRGIIDSEVDTEYMISLNLDLPVRVLQFRPSQWLFESNTRIIDFDLHIVPFIDAAIYKNPALERDFKDTDFTYKNMLVTAGVEAIIFPEFFRSLFLRISFGLNFSTLLNTSRYELFIGTDLHY